MAAQLIEEMTTPWHSDAYADTFAQAIDELVEQKVSAGKTEQVTPLEESQEGAKATNVVDLTELLAKSLQGNKAPRPKAPAKAPAAKRKKA